MQIWWSTYPGGKSRFGGTSQTLKMPYAGLRGIPQLYAMANDVPGNGLGARKRLGSIIIIVPCVQSARYQFVRMPTTNCHGATWPRAITQIGTTLCNHTTGISCARVQRGSKKRDDISWRVLKRRIIRLNISARKGTRWEWLRSSSTAREAP